MNEIPSNDDTRHELSVLWSKNGKNARHGKECFDEMHRMWPL